MLFLCFEGLDLLPSVVAGGYPDFSFAPEGRERRAAVGRHPKC